MVSFQLWHILFTLYISWNVLIPALSVEVCNCPDFRLSLSAVEGVTTKKLHRGFRYVAKKDSDVELKCELEDLDNEAVDSVTYKFHKTWQLPSTQPIFLSDTKRELCETEPTDTPSPTCTLKSVQYTENPGMEINIDNGANHIYQCSATISLKDGGEVILWSHSIQLDVYYPPVKNPNIVTDTKTVSKGKAMEKFECDLPDSNPKTKAQWSFRKDENDSWQIIDIPNDSTRGSRLTIVEEKIEAGVTDSRGTLMVMIFNPDEDVGFYKCEGVHDTEFDADDAKFEIANFETKWTNHDDSGVLQLKPISAITFPKLVDQDSSVNFTVYARDTPGRGDYGNVIYTWQIENANIDFDASPHLELSNNGRTLTVNKLSDYVSKSFSCQMKRSKPDKSLDTATSSTMGFRNDDVVIAPEFLMIPLTFFTKYPDLSLVEPGSSLKATPNKAYMMPTAALAGDNPQQLLLKADSFRYYINDMPFSFISDNADNYDNDTNVGITKEKFDQKLPSRTDDRCIYYQYMRAWGNHYQVVEVMKIQRTRGCSDADDRKQLTDLLDNATIKVDESPSKLTITFSESDKLTIPTTVKMDLLDSNRKGLQTKKVSPDTAVSCSSYIPLSPVEFSTENMSQKLYVKIYIEACPNISHEREVNPKKQCSKPTIDSSSNVSSITPDQAKINIGETYTVTCKSGFEPQEAELTCKDDGNLSTQPSCKKSSGGLQTWVIILIVVGVIAVCIGVAVTVYFKYKPGKVCKHESEKQTKERIDMKSVEENVNAEADVE
ncbi:hypothetical protein ACHWQZ_G003846 [Mnemiopsis leidyi]